MRAQEAWRLPAAYRYSLNLDSQGRAWEFLRRNPTFRQQVSGLLAETAPGPTTATPIPPAPVFASPRTASADPLEPWGLHFRPEPCAPG